MAVVPYALCSLADVKSYLGITKATYDSLLELLINACTDWIESECAGRRLFDVGTQISDTFDGDFDRTGRNKIFAKRYPIPFRVYDVFFNNGSQETPDIEEISRDNYTVDLNGGIFIFDYALPYGNMRGRENVIISYQGGFDPIPNDLRLACIKMVAKEFDKRKSQGITQESVGGGTATWNESVDPEVIKIIRKYRWFGSQH